MFYFAYSSNLKHNQIKNRCPNSKFVKNVYLERYRFVYDDYSTLDRYEGYPTSYDRKTVGVKDDDGKEYNARVYLRETRERKTIGGIQKNYN